MKKLHFLLVLFSGFMGLAQAQESSALFPYGVASGDPLPDAVVIWTKVEPSLARPELNGQWVMATDEALQEVVQKGEFTTTATSDYTVKIDVRGLEPGTYYYYQFTLGGATSPAGRTKTAPKGAVDRVRFAVVSCSNYQAGYFNNYANIADRDSLDAVIHLGDYIYEYAEGGYGDSVLTAAGARALEPATELLSLEDYRARYGLYRRDPDLQRVHQQHPFITVWDDHETANDAYKDGAENHQDGEGDWEERKAMARQAYAEWLPIRGEADRIYRKFQFGDLAELIMLDTRLEGRDEQVMDIADPSLYDAQRSMLGATQKEWLLNSLEQSPAQWKVLGNQVMFAEYNIGWAAMASPDYTPEQLESIFLDIWDGYPVERAELIGFIEQRAIDDVVIVTGDVHCSFAYDIALRPTGEEATYDPATGAGSVAVEFVTPGITSSNYDEIVGRAAAQMLQYQINKPLPTGVNPNPHMKYVDLIQHGYLILELTPEKAQADWYFTKDVLTPTREEVHTEGWFTRTGANHLEQAEK